MGLAKGPGTLAIESLTRYLQSELRKGGDQGGEADMGMSIWTSNIKGLVAIAYFRKGRDTGDPKTVDCVPLLEQHSIYSGLFEIARVCSSFLVCS